MLALRQKGPPPMPVVPIDRFPRIVPPPPRERDWLDVATVEYLDADAAIKAVANHCNISMADMLSARRSRHITLPRQIAMFLCREHTLESFPSIGRKLNRDHSTIMHGWRAIARLLPVTPELQKTVSAIRYRLGVRG